MGTSGGKAGQGEASLLGACSGLDFLNMLSPLRVTDLAQPGPAEGAAGEEGGLILRP